MQEKRIQLNGLDINYKIIGAGKTPVVLLHGWGVSSDKYIITADKILDLISSYVFYIPDLPGFGKSEEPSNDWKLDDYVEFTRSFIKAVAQRTSGFEPIKDILDKAVKDEGSILKLEEEKVILMAHSFGARIAIKYAVKYPEDLCELVMTGAAGIKHPLTPKQMIFFCMSKIGKVIFGLPGLRALERYAKRFLYKAAREKDYANASLRMKEVMKNALAEDLTPLLSRISAPTMLIWGENDHSTPLRDGELMRDKIKGSKLFVVKDINHSLPYNDAGEFAKIFLENYKTSGGTTDASSEQEAAPLA